MTTILFQQMLGGALVTVRAELRDLRLDVPDGLVVSVVDVTSGKPERLPGPYPAGKLSAAEHMAFEAAATICEAAAVMARKDGKPMKARDRVATLRIAAELWSLAQEERHEQSHPTGRSDEATYREEAPYGSES